METTNGKLKILCIFHTECADGFASAWIVGQFFGFDRVEMVPLNYGDPIPDLTGRQVYIVDFSFPPEELLPAMTETTNVVMLDHHSSAIKHWEKYAVDYVKEDAQVMPKNIVFVADTKKSGIGITWDFFYATNFAMTLPIVLAHLQVYDLWQFKTTKLVHSREITTAIYSSGMVHALDFEAFGKLVKTSPVKELAHDGTIILKANEITIKAILKRTMKMVEIEGHTVPMANVPYNFASQAGEMMAQGFPFSVSYEDQHVNGVRKYSFRSTEGEGVFVDQIAEQYGGGGHKHSAGCITALTDPLIGMKGVHHVK